MALVIVQMRSSSVGWIANEIVICWLDRVIFIVFLVISKVLYLPITPINIDRTLSGGVHFWGLNSGAHLLLERILFSCSILFKGKLLFNCFPSWTNHQETQLIDVRGPLHYHTSQQHYYPQQRKLQRRGETASSVISQTPKRLSRSGNGQQVNAMQCSITSRRRQAGRKLEP